MNRSAIIFCAVAITLAFLRLSHAGAILDETYDRLDKIRMEKKIQLFDFMDKTRKNAEAILSDPAMLAFFHLKNSYYRLCKTSPPPEEVVKAVNMLIQNIRQQYIRNYIAFYDILFVNREGDIFYTIRQQADYHQNLFEGQLNQTALARQLIKNPRTGFVDYQFYEVSNEPSCFYVIPVLKENQLEGWFILQLAINKINDIFTQEKALGQTGEVFLVNKAQYMLTNSRFYNESSILKRHLSRDNILTKFKEGEGRKIIVDYRGYRALSSFEVCRLEESEWLLIAKIDEDEVLTEHYKRKSAEVNRDLLQVLSKDQVKPIVTPPVEDPCDLLVDMDEFRKSHEGQKLCTYGVSTCTVLIVSYPGKFAYLGHISSLDRIYSGHTTDLIANMLKQIKTFDIYPYEKRNLKATLVATHLNTLPDALHMLVADGFLLSQINFMHNPKAQYASPMHDYVNDVTTVEWVLDRESGSGEISCSSNLKTMSAIVAQLMRYEGN